MPSAIPQEGRSYTFSDYFYLGNPTHEVLAEFGYRFRLERLALPNWAWSLSPWITI